MRRAVQQIPWPVSALPLLFMIAATLRLLRLVGPAGSHDTADPVLGVLGVIAALMLIARFPWLIDLRGDRAKA